MAKRKEKIMFDTRKAMELRNLHGVENFGKLTIPQMLERGKLIELLESAESAIYWNSSDKGFIEKIADHLIDNGVTVQEWIPASEPPTRKDADKYGRVLAMEMGMMALVNYKGPINYPDRFPYWMSLPPAPEENK